MTGYEIMVHPAVEYADNLIRAIRTELGIPVSIFCAKAIKDDVMSVHRAINRQYFPHVFGDDEDGDNPAQKE